MTRFIIDTYNKYDPVDKKSARHIFFHNDQWWAIKEFEVQNGELMRPLRIEEADNYNDYFYLYNTYNEALQFVQQIKGIS